MALIASITAAPCTGSTATVVQRAVGFYVTHRSAHGRREPLQGADLIHHICDEIRWGDIHVTPTEACEVGIRDVRTDGDATPCRGFERPKYSGRIARMKAASDIGARDDLDHRGIVSHAPRAVAFAKIAVEIDRFHDGFLSLRIEQREDRTDRFVSHVPRHRANEHAETE